MEANTITKYNKKTTPQLKKTAGEWFRRFIRLRDCDDNGYARCISSGRTIKIGTKNYQAGHYYSAGHYPNLEFEEDNVHAQSMSDNYYKSANLIEYRKNLIKKIGEDRVESLDLKAAAYKKNGFKQNRFYYIEIIETYKQKVKELSKEKMFKV